MTVALVGALVLPAGLDAQQARPRRDRDDDPFRVFSFSGQRGRIGVLVNTRANAETDKIGAELEAVTPGGPAAKAGLKAGDIITKFGTTALGGLPSDDRDESGPAIKLLALARELDPGDSVQVEYRRGTENRRATIVAEDLGGAMAFRFPDDGLGRLREMAIDPDIRMRLGEPGGFSFSFGAPWAGLNLVTLDADLGQYFGTTEGVLVVKAPTDSALPLKSGDVILAIDGRKPTSPEHAMRIVRSYEEGEAVKLDIMRRQRRMTLTWTVPERDQLFRRLPSRVRDRQEF
jgi:S1-C subfamily serine protease